MSTSAEDEGIGLQEIDLEESPRSKRNALDAKTTERILLEPDKADSDVTNFTSSESDETYDHCASSLYCCYEKDGSLLCKVAEPVVSRQVLCFEQVYKLHTLLSRPLSLNGRLRHSSINIRLRDLIPRLKRDLVAAGLFVSDVRLNGGAASHVLRVAPEHYYAECLGRDYGDIDLIFNLENCDDNKHESQTLDVVKGVALNTLKAILNEKLPEPSFTEETMCSLFIRKMIKVNNGHDCWSLISLGFVHDPTTDYNVELKFVKKMRRQFEFSVDSFQIILDTLFAFYKVSSHACLPTEPGERIYPTVIMQTMYGDVSQAMDHLHYRLIVTRHPEEIRGGGLLKYCYLLLKGYQPGYQDSQDRFEKYMCSRFFIDFNSTYQQSERLENYLATHFGPDSLCEKVNYLQILYVIVNRSTVCLMGRERFDILSLISDLLRFYHSQYLLKLHYEDVQASHFELQGRNNLIVDQIFYGISSEHFETCSNVSSGYGSISYGRLTDSASPDLESTVPSPCLSPL